MSDSPMPKNTVENPEAKPNVDNLSKMAGEATKIENNISSANKPGAKIEEKRGRGRPTKEQAAKMQKEKATKQQPGAVPPGVDAAVAAAQSIPSKEICKPIVSFIQAAAVSYVQDPKAQMRPDEFDNVATAMGLVMDKYLPVVMAQYGAEAMLILGLGQYGMRIMALKRLQAIPESDGGLKVPKPSPAQAEPLRPNQEQPVATTPSSDLGPEIVPPKLEGQFNPPKLKTGPWIPSELKNH